MIQSAEYKALLDPASLAKIGHLELLSRHVVDGLLSGKHRSRQKGDVFEFAEHRPYSKGDEIHFIDWRVLAKTDRYYVKQFIEETNLQVVSVVDCSGSMEFGLSTISKLDFARMACACLSRLLLRQRDAVGIALVDQGIRQFIPPRSRASHLMAVLDSLRRVTPANTTSLSAALLEVARRLKRRGMVVIFSDCLTDLRALGNAIRLVRVRGHEVLLFHVMAPEEINFSFTTWTRFECLESRSVYLDLDAPTVRAEYCARVGKFLGEVQRRFAENGCDYVLTMTDQFLGDVLGQYLARRAARTKH